ncbi:MAG: HD domain-containing protein [Caldilineaceae bacterium]
MDHLSQLLHLLDQANHLKQLPRTGWLFAGVAAPESIAEHTCVTALLTLFMGEQINADWVNQGLDCPLDVAKAARMALLHDLAESVVTDFPKRTTKLIGSQIKHDAEAAALRQILGDLPSSSHDQRLCQEYTAALTAEARLVKDADMLEMIHQARKYKARGHTNLDEFLAPPPFYFPLSQALFDALIN